MLFFVTPKFCKSIFFSFSWELKWPQEKLKTMLMQNFALTKKEHIIVCYGIFCGGQLSTSALFYKKTSNSPHGKESKTVLDSGFHVVESGFQVLHFSLCQWNYEPFMAWWSLNSRFLDVYSQFPCPWSRTQDSMLKICPRGELTNGRVESWLAFTSYTLYYLHLMHFMVILQWINKGDSCYKCKWNQSQTSPGL